MRLESALNASRQGIDSHGKAISVIGDNISNSSTVGFKGSRVEFADLLSSGGSGTNNNSIPSSGSGTKITRVRPIHETGVIEASGRPLDLAIAGAGFFMVGDAQAPVLTRAGNFEINPEGILVDSSGQPVLGVTGEEGAALGPLDMVNINLNGEATNAAAISGNISSQAAISEPPANPERFSDLNAAAAFSGSVGIFDSLGNERPVSLFFFKTDNNQWTVQAYVDSAELDNEAGTPTLIGTVNMTFGEDGTLNQGGAADVAVDLNIQANWGGGAAAGNAVISLANMTQFATSSQFTNVTRNGQSGGSIQSYQIDPDGGVFANLSSGARTQIGILQLATVRNIDGLDRVGSNGFRETIASGERVVGAPGQLGFGALESSALERSTIDLSKEFVDLVLYQRGYQANSQILNAANDLIRDTISLIR